MIRKGATAIAAFDLCPRKWAFDAAAFEVADAPGGPHEHEYRWLASADAVGPGVLVALPAPPSPWQSVGSAVHASIEGFYKGRALRPSFVEADAIAMAGIHHLPTPRPDLWVEKNWSKTLGAHKVTGTFDLVDPGIRLYDHKTTGDYKWAHTPETLAENTQAVLYTWALGVDRISAQWTYFMRSKPYSSRPVSTIVHVRDERLRRFERTLDAMQAAEGCDPIRDLPPTPSACTAFGGCPYQSRCVDVTFGQRVNPPPKKAEAPVSKTFPDYHDARAYAEQQTRELRQAHGIEKMPDTRGGECFSVKMLPNPENRFGWELRCEAVEVDMMLDAKGVRAFFGFENPNVQGEPVSNVAAMKAAMQGINPPPANGTPLKGEAIVAAHEQARANVGAPPAPKGKLDPITPYSPDLPHNDARTYWRDDALYKANPGCDPWFKVPARGAPPPPPPEDDAPPPPDERAEAYAAKLGGTAAPGTALSPSGATVATGAVTMPAPEKKRGPGRPRKNPPPEPAGPELAPGGPDPMRAPPEPATCPKCGGPACVHACPADIAPAFKALPMLDKQDMTLEGERIVHEPPPAPVEPSPAAYEPPPPELSAALRTLDLAAVTGAFRGEPDTRARAVAAVLRAIANLLES